MIVTAATTIVVLATAWHLLKVITDDEPFNKLMSLIGLGFCVVMLWILLQ